MHLKSNITLKSDLQIQYKHTSSTYAFQTCSPFDAALVHNNT